jgi:predicted acyltransferase
MFPDKSQRLLSLDALRGAIMVLLALEAAGLYEALEPLAEGTMAAPLVEQFFHHPWNGLRFWDLIQPGFMFIAGTAMAISLQRQKEMGETRVSTGLKTLKRSGWLFFWGVLSYAVRKTGLSFELWNVLTQLAFTTLLTWLVIEWRFAAQAAFCAGLLLLTECLYRFTGVPGFDQPFTDQHNFGNYVDLLLMGKINGGGWVAINAIPTSVHTIAGAMAGRFILRKPASPVPLVLWGTGTLIAGLWLDVSGVTPIIKRIATSSFTLASLGWCLLALAAAWEWVDRRGHRSVGFLKVIGMNSIFIYLFFEIVGARWFNGYAGAVTNGLMTMGSVPQFVQHIVTALVIFGLEWGMCLFLFRKGIFFRL